MTFDEYDPEEGTSWPLQWCTCSYKFTGGFVGLFDLEYCKTGDYIWVCGGCLWPSLEYWETFIETCPECGQEFNAPWEDLCSDCVYRFPSNRPDSESYLDWQWARVQSIPGHYRAVDDEGNGSRKLVNSP